VRLRNGEDSAMGKAVIDASKKAKTGSRRNALKETFVERLQIIMDTIFENVDKSCLRKIYLFGSYAYGEPNKDSDIDLCVVFADDIDDNEAYMKIAKPLYHKKIIPLDMLVYHEYEFNLKKMKNGIVNTIITKGRLLYG
jgi:predicted nucleotidyltransferase